MGMLGGVFQNLIAALAPVIQIVSSVASNLINVFALAMTYVGGVIGAMTPILDIVAGVVSGLAAAFGMLVQFLSPVLAGIFKIGAAFVQLVVSPFTALMSVLSVFKPIIEPLQHLFGAVGNAIGAIFGAIGSAISSLVSSGISLLVSAFQLLEPFIIRLATYIEALAMVINSLLGSGDEEKKAPGRAPPAARQATSGSIQSFITKAYVSAFSAGGGNSDQAFKSNVSKKMDSIDESAQAIAKDIKNFLKQAGEAATGAAVGAAKGAGKAADAVVNPGRFLLSMVTGK